VGVERLGQVITLQVYRTVIVSGQYIGQLRAVQEIGYLIFQTEIILAMFELLYTGTQGKHL